jgi:hypothetical protein
MFLAPEGPSDRGEAVAGRLEPGAEQVDDVGVVDLGDYMVV